VQDFCRVGIAGRQPFRDAIWSSSKTRLLARVGDTTSRCRLVDSQAEVDVESATVKLMVEIDSGPAFTGGSFR